MHKLVTHQYFMDEMTWGDLIILLKYLEFAEVIEWQQTRELMLTTLRPYLKKKDTTAQDLFTLPTDEIHVPDHSIANEDVDWYKQYVANYRKQHS